MSKISFNTTVLRFVMMFCIVASLLPSCKKMETDASGRRPEDSSLLFFMRSYNYSNSISSSSDFSWSMYPELFYFNMNDQVVIYSGVESKERDPDKLYEEFLPGTIGLHFPPSVLQEGATVHLSDKDVCVIFSHYNRPIIDAFRGSIYTHKNVVYLSDAEAFITIDAIEHYADKKTHKFLVILDRGYKDRDGNYIEYNRIKGSFTITGSLKDETESYSDNYILRSGTFDVICWTNGYLNGLAQESIEQYKELYKQYTNMLDGVSE